MHVGRTLVAVAVAVVWMSGCGSDDQGTDCSSDGPSPPCGTVPHDGRTGDAAVSGTGDGGLTWALASKEEGGCTRVDLTWTPEPAEGAAGACLTRDPVENFTEFGSGSFEVGNNGYVFGLAAPQVDDLVYKREGQPDVHAELSGPAFVAVFPEWDYEELDELEVRSGGQAIERCEYTNGDLAMCRAV